MTNKRTLKAQIKFLVTPTFHEQDTEFYLPKGTLIKVKLGCISGETFSSNSSGFVVLTTSKDYSGNQKDLLEENIAVEASQGDVDGFSRLFYGRNNLRLAGVMDSLIVEDDAIYVEVRAIPFEVNTLHTESSESDLNERALWNTLRRRRGRRT